MPKTHISKTRIKTKTKTEPTSLNGGIQDKRPCSTHPARKKEGGKEGKEDVKKPQALTWTRSYHNDSLDESLH